MELLKAYRTLVSNGNAINSFYSYKFDKLDDQGFPTFKDINEKDEEGNAVVHSLQEMYDRALSHHRASGFLCD